MRQSRRRDVDRPVERPATVAKIAGCGSTAGLPGLGVGVCRLRTAGCGIAAGMDRVRRAAARRDAFGIISAGLENSDRIAAAARQSSPMARQAVPGTTSVIMTKRPAREKARTRLRAAKGSYRMATECPRALEGS